MEGAHYGNFYGVLFSFKERFNFDTENNNSEASYLIQKLEIDT